MGETFLPKVYCLLLHFLQHHGRPISHEELISKVWGGRIADNSAIRVAVNALRKALNENIASQSSLIRKI